MEKGRPRAASTVHFLNLYFRTGRYHCSAEHLGLGQQVSSPELFEGSVIKSDKAQGGCNESREHRLSTHRGHESEARRNLT